MRHQDVQIPARPDGVSERLATGPLTATIDAGALRDVRYGGIEVLRMLSCPIRDADWATLAEVVTEERLVGESGYLRHFTVGGGALAAQLDVSLNDTGLTAVFQAEAMSDIILNRAGFALLHPLAGVVGFPLEVTHPGGGVSRATFPQLIAPDQPAKNIAGLAHVVDGVAVKIGFSGEVFEMEDQRNWTDASFKTYCRPLSEPRPFVLQRGERLRQTMALTCRAARSARVARPTSATGKQPTRPVVALAAERRWWRPGDAAVIAQSGVGALQLRITAGESLDWLHEALRAARAADMTVTLEVVLPGDPGALDGIGVALEAMGMHPDRVVALPAAYLRSHQPEGPWPVGPTPEDAARTAALAFPMAEIGVGMLTYFPELNRRRPAAGSGDFVTFGTSAIVHAADDLSVMQTLEALPDVFATAHDIAGARPLRLGLAAIGLRGNPYGSGPVANPDGCLIAMAEADPRQSTEFAARFALAFWHAAAKAGVAEVALAMPSGPFGMQCKGVRYPIADAIAQCARTAR